MDVKEEAAAEAMTTDIDDEDGDVVAWPAVVVPAPRQVRITDSPFPAWEADGDDDEEGRLGVVDRRADEFIMWFHEQLRMQQQQRAAAAAAKERSTYYFVR
ncbi:hypothetical protein OsJ_19240 [Oryza sativa Japonica Group]|nr:hypothetical protein OsJ_19240 [Oryza sativa Japonica Group]